MSERKVLNKYYPPDFDPAKIPRLHLPKDRQYTVRLMAPCNMRCKTCGEYIYKGKKFNARKETVQGEDYLGIKVFRFYIKCTRCLAEITFKTDPQNADYIVEHGATRNFQALKLAEEQAEREQKELEEEEANNPMKLLENRTKASKYEMEILESLEELRDINQRQANVDFDKLLQQNAEMAKKVKQTQEEEDEEFIRSVFGPKDELENGSSVIIKRLQDDSSDDDESTIIKPSGFSFLQDNPTDLLLDDRNKPKEKENPAKKAKTESSFFSKKENLKSLVRVKTPNNIASKKTDNNLTNNHSHETNEKTNQVPSVKSQGLSLLGNYSDSDSND